MAADQVVAPPVTAAPRKRRDYFPYVMLAPALIVLAVTSLYPFFYAIWASLQSYLLVKPKARHFIGPENYWLAFTDKDFWTSLGTTFYYTAAAVTIEFLLGLAMALLVARESRGKGVIRTLLLLPMVMTPVGVAFMWRIMFNPSLGIINYLLGSLGLPEPMWVADSSTAMVSLLLVDAWQWAPFMFLLLLAGLLSQPAEPIEAAAVDGANRAQAFWHVTIPFLRPIFGIALLFRMIDAFRTFDIIYAMTGGGPGRSTQTLNIYVFLQSFKFFDIGYGSALGLILLFIIIFTSQRVVRWSKIDLFD